eukprot:TRINITY_DN6785_c0_g1::TRINITY_DN6785_c0_g1_i1::g.3037::m.3037 TRINITY_DN6785_c0_g1::TRINITY_DN6785_c0_g1_i1::g.3037  ORF type:complete len:262 (-),score=50.01,sp/Q9Y7X4/YGRG_SCHPO/38.40/9e-45 TRINITY_DN6785_c0_g1_i1:302-1087(-)
MSLTPTDTTLLGPASKVYASDIAAAFTASFLVSPWVTVVDKGILQNASGAVKLSVAVRKGFTELFLTPHRFFARKEFYFIWGVYFGTYAAANTIDSFCQRRSHSPEIPKFLGTSGANMILCIAKDRAFTQMFGTKAPSHLPFGTYACFVSRDCLTIGASFNMPKVVAQYLHRHYDFSEKNAQVFAQLTAPMAIQLISTPLHLLGLDLYNNPQWTIAQRATFLKREYFKSTFARCCRIFPAFGIGGVGNTHFRKTFRTSWVE